MEAVQSSAWSGMLPVGDSALAVTDTGGVGAPIVYLNGAYGKQAHWKEVIAELGPSFRHITYDLRGRGRSKRSADYSFDTALCDLDVLLKARGLQEPVLVGWSYGGIMGWRWADRNPSRVLGLVTVDAFPLGLTGEEGRARTRRLFRRMGPLLLMARFLGLTANMTTEEQAQVNIDANEIGAASGPVLERLSCPALFVLASGDSLGAKGGEMDEGRAALEPLFARNPNLRLSARVASNHTQILRRDSTAVAEAVRQLAAASRRLTEEPPT